jgi:hypothetical protein
MKRLFVILSTAILISPIAASGRAYASQFTVVLSVSPHTMPYNAYPTLQAHTRINSTCTATIHYKDGTTPADLRVVTKHVGRTGITTWRWHEVTHAGGGTAAVVCTHEAMEAAATVYFTVIHPAAAARPTPKPAAPPSPLTKAQRAEYKTISCPQQGYSITLPPHWSQGNDSSCNQSLIFWSDDQYGLVAMGMYTIKDGMYTYKDGVLPLFGNPTASDIRKDIAYGLPSQGPGPLETPITWGVKTVSGVEFQTGMAKVATGTPKIPASTKADAYAFEVEGVVDDHRIFGIVASVDINAYDLVARVLTHNDSANMELGQITRGFFPSIKFIKSVSRHAQEPSHVPDAGGTGFPRSTHSRPAAALTVSASVDPANMPYNAFPTLTATTAVGATCAASVVYTTGRKPTSFDGSAQVVPAGGRVRWAWHEETKGSGGTATVTCTYQRQTRSATATFTVQQ